MLVLEVRGDVYAMEVLRDDLLVCKHWLLRVGRLASRPIDFNAVDKKHTLVLRTQAFQYGYCILRFVATGKLIPQTCQRGDT